MGTIVHRPRPGATTGCGGTVPEVPDWLHENRLPGDRSDGHRAGPPAVAALARALAERLAVCTRPVRCPRAEEATPTRPRREAGRGAGARARHFAVGGGSGAARRQPSLLGVTSEVPTPALTWIHI